MTWRARSLSRRLVPTVLVLALTGCSGLFGTNYPADLPHHSLQLLVDVPLAPAGLDTSRIALTRSAVSIDYFADSEWTERAPLLVQTALLNSFDNSKAINGIDRESAGLRADFILRTELRHFEAVYDSPDGPPEIWVAINVRLIDPASRDIVAQTSFEGRERAPANNMQTIMSSFDEALGRVMKDIVLWTVTNPALSIKRS
jgi:cholesterol transport system auxiliary component